MDIMACILKNCNESARKTRLLYGCNLSFLQFDLYKECLVEAGLLKVSTREDGVEIFKTTEKGKEFLGDCDQIKGFLATVERRKRR